MRSRTFLVVGCAILGGIYFSYKFYKGHHSDVHPLHEPDGYKVAYSQVHDYKPVSLRVDSQHRIFARSRIPGIVLDIQVEEGNLVKEGDVLVRVVDSKIAPQIESIEAQTTSARDQLDLAKTDYERAEKLKESKVITQAAFDQKQTALKVAENALKSLQAQKTTLLEQQKEGQILAPISGKILTIPVTVGAVMMPGENGIELAGGNFVLKLSVPESHAGYIKKEDTVFITMPNHQEKEGTIIKIYPKLQNGQIIADVKLDDIENLYVDQILTGRIKTSSRKAILIPEDILIQKYGLYFVKLKHAGEISVEVGKKTKDMVEIVSGITEGDELLCP